MSIEQSGAYAQLSRKRINHKGWITRRINEIRQLIADNGSRTRIRTLRDKMLEVFEEEKDINVQLEQLNVQEDGSWLLDERDRIDFCISEVEEYLESRAGEESSKASDTASWVRNNAETTNPPEDLYENVDELSRDMSRLQVASDDGYLMPQGLLGETGQDGTLTSNTQPTDDACNRMKTTGQSVKFNLEGNKQPSQEQENVANGPHKDVIERNMTLHNMRLHNRSSTRLNDEPVYHHKTRRGDHIKNMASNQLPEMCSRNENNISLLDSNSVDGWIDALDGNHEPTVGVDAMQTNIAISAMIVQQSMPRIEVPKFSGLPSKWVEFISKFRDIVHRENYLNGIRKCALLFQSLTEDAKRSVIGLPTNYFGYVKALKRLKALFGDRSDVASAVIQRLTQGPVVRADSQKELSEYYYDLSDCVIALQHLNYLSDLRSTEVLAQAVRRLPRRLQFKWSERTYVLKSRMITPTLVEFESWMHERVMAYRKAASFVNTKQIDHPKKGRNEFNGMLNTKEAICVICQGSHCLTKCADYKKLSPNERFECVKKYRLCFFLFGERAQE